MHGPNRSDRGHCGGAVGRLLATIVVLVSASVWPAADDEALVDIPDPNLRAAIESALGKGANASITVGEMGSLSGLEAAGAGIGVLTGLEHATALSELRLSDNLIEDIAPLAGLTRLSDLRLDGNRISNLRPLADLTSLDYLALDRNRIVDITPLAGMRRLDTVSLDGNRIVDVTPLAGQGELRQLSLGANSISDIGPLAELPNLGFLGLHDNRIADITPLAELRWNLRRLWLSDNEITSVAALARLTALQHLLLTANEITEVRSLADLTALQWLLLGDNRIADVTPLADLTNLELLSLNANQIVDLTPLANLTSLRSLDLTGNRVADVSALANLTALGVLWLRGNQIADITPVANLTGLIHLRLGNNLISDLRPLEQLGNLDELGLGDNAIDDVSPLAAIKNLSILRLFGNGIEHLGPLVENEGLRHNELVHVWGNPLSDHSRDVDIPTLEERGVRVIHSGHDVPFLPVGADAERQGFVRIVNKGERPYLPSPLAVWLRATDDAGRGRPAPFVALEQGRSAHFNSRDLEAGNPGKGLSGGVGAGDGGWRLELYPEMRAEVSAYMRTRDGFLTGMNALAPESAAGYRIATFNPGGNLAQVSILRLANPGRATANVTIRGVDDQGLPSAGEVRLDLRPGEARMLTAQQLESGRGLVGALGDGVGKWRLEVSADAAIQVMSLLESPTGHLTNLSSVPDNAATLPDGRTRHRVPYFPAADDPHGRQGFARVVNEQDATAAIEIEAFDRTGKRHGPTTLSVRARNTVHFNSRDLEAGNPDKGIPSGVGTGAGDWRLELTTPAEIRVLAYLRNTGDGFLTAMHDTVRGAADGQGGHVYEVAIFNPASNLGQVSQLRAVNEGEGPAEVTIAGIDDRGRASAEATPAEFTLAPGAARTITAQQLESGNGLTAGLGDGTGKWRLLVRSNQPLQLMNLLASPTGHLSNLSGARTRYEP